MNNFADELTFSAVDGFVSIFQNRMTVSGYIDRWCTGETLKPLSLSLFSLLFLFPVSFCLSPHSLSLSTVLWMKGDVSPNKVIRWVSASLIFILFVLGTAIWKETGIVGRVNRERVPGRHLQKSRGNYPGTDANCVYNYWHLCKWAALAIRREVYHNLSRCFVLRFSDWRGCWEIGTFCHLNHGLP